MNKRILIIEDEESIADLEKDYLELSNFEVEVANDGEQGLAQAMEQDFDLIILDLMLPGVDGFEICRQVRDSKNTPIIMVSAKKDDIDKIRGITVVVHNSGNMVIDISTCQNLLVGRCIFVMGTEADQDDYVFKRNTDDFIQITNQFLTDDILAHPEAGHIADHNGDLVFRAHQLIKCR